MRVEAGDVECAVREDLRRRDGARPDSGVADAVRRAETHGAFLDAEFALRLEVARRQPDAAATLHDGAGGVVRGRHDVRGLREGGVRHDLDDAAVVADAERARKRHVHGCLQGAAVQKDASFARGRKVSACRCEIENALVDGE